MQPAPKYVLAGVMGWPVAHSRSPDIHNHWLSELAIPGSYVLLEVPPQRLDQALRALPALGFVGCNLTIPHKVQAMASVDQLDPVARRVGAVNTVVVQPDEKLLGRNTDAAGFICSVYDGQPDWRAEAGPAVVIGAGGAARAVIAGLIDEGALEIRVVNRSMDKAMALQGEFGSVVRATAWEARHACLAKAGLLVNTTNQGMHGQGELDLVLDELPSDTLVCDVVYVPLQTGLLATARARGNPTINGLGMLVHQARIAFEAWTRCLPPYSEALRRKIEATL